MAAVSGPADSAGLSATVPAVASTVVAVDAAVAAVA